MKELFKSKWGKWTDVIVGASSGDKYLLQARRHEDGKVQFRVVHDTIFGSELLTLDKLKEV